jgi:hypothetical protein
MRHAAPTRGSPVGWLLSNLPFVNSEDGERLHRILELIFEAPGKHDADRTFMLHLVVAPNNELVLLEMVATHVYVTESEPVIVLTGRQVDSDLAGFMACGSAVALSETNEQNECANRSAELRSVSQAGSIKADNNTDDAFLATNYHGVSGDCSSSKISSVTMPSLLNPQSKPGSRSEASADSGTSTTFGALSGEQHCSVPEDGLLAARPPAHLIDVARGNGMRGIPCMPSTLRSSPSSASHKTDHHTNPPEKSGDGNHTSAR